MRDNAGNSDLFQAARRLLSGSFQGVLSSHSLDYPGYPFGSVLPFSLAPDGWPLLLISHLAKHTRNLLAAPQCSLTLSEPGAGDLQQRMRLTLLATALPLVSHDHALAERHFRYFPESRDYYARLNFRFFSLQPERAYCVAGFGAARWMGVDRLRAGNPFSLPAEAAALKQLDTAFGERLYRQLNSRVDLRPADEAPLLLVGLDSGGLDLRQNDRLHRIPFPAEIANLEQATRLLETILNPG